VMLGCYGANAFKSLARSHPSVFRAHHPDLRLCRVGGGVVAALPARAARGGMGGAGRKELLSAAGGRAPG
jgi:hypothetical protein